MRSHFLHNIFTTSAVLFCTFNKFLNGLNDKKIKFIRLLKLEVEGVSRFYGINLYDVFFMVCWRLYGALLEQYIQEIINHCDKLCDYENLLSQ